MQTQETVYEGGDAIKVGFITMHEVQEGTYRAGLLVLDGRGVPVEVWITDTVRPTTQHRILYGKALEPHIAVDLCGARLLANLKNRPLLVLADSEHFLALHRAELPVVWLRAGDEIDVELRSSGLDAGDEDDLLSEGVRPVTPVWARDYDEQDCTGRFARVRPLFDDVLEPFTRVRRAIEEVDRQASREG